MLPEAEKININHGDHQIRDSVKVWIIKDDETLAVLEVIKNTQSESEVNSA